MRDTATVSAADIARLARVGRAAVSNWRRRHPDFPQPVGGTPTSPVFALSEIEAWLRDQGKLQHLPLEEWAWQQLRTEAGDDLRLAEVLGDAGDLLLEWQSAGEIQVRRAGALAGSGAAEAVAELAAERGAIRAFEFLFGRYQETQARRASATPAEIAYLMATLAGDARTILDPTCGTGELLLAALETSATENSVAENSPAEDSPAENNPAEDGAAENGAVLRRLLGQDAAADATRLVALRMALRSGDATIRTGDSLRRDAFPGALADVVLCDPPFHERAWGHEELTADPRWEYGLPPRLEPELAWVQHALAHLAPGGRAVVLMPAVAAGRRSGRRIRAQLLRKGALRVVMALSASHHLWLLEPPEGGTPATVLMINSADPETIAAARQAYGSDPDHDEPGVSRAVPIIELLDEEVDLTPARHLSVFRSERTAERFTETHDRLTAVLGGLGGLVPAVRPSGDRQKFAAAPIAELERIGYLTIHQAPLRGEAEDGGDGGEPLLTTEDVIEGRPASGRVLSNDVRWIVTRVGDIVVAMVARRFAARVMEADGALLGPQLSLLRLDPERLDPYFVAGVLRSSANVQSSTVQSTGGTSRADIRRTQVPRLPLEEQRRYGDAFRRMTEFESALRSSAVMGAEMAQLLADGVAEGTLAPIPGKSPPVRP